MSTKMEKLRALTEVRDPMLRMQRLLNERAVAEAVGKMEMMKGEKGDQGEPGEDGHTPVKGTDYFTDEEILSIISYIQSRVKNGEDGKNGKNGQTPARGIDYWTKEDQDKILSNVLKNVPKPKDGVSPKVEDIVKLVLKEIKMPDTKDLISKGELAEFLRRGGFRGGGDTIAAGSGISVTTNANGQKEISTTGSGAFSILAATGTVDDSNVTFTFASVPVLVNINGSFYNAGATSGGTVMWTIVGTTVTLASPVGDGGCIFGMA